MFALSQFLALGLAASVPALVSAIPVKERCDLDKLAPKVFIISMVSVDLSM